VRSCVVTGMCTAVRLADCVRFCVFSLCLCCVCECSGSAVTPCVWPWLLVFGCWLFFGVRFLSCLFAGSIAGFDVNFRSPFLCAADHYL